MAFSHQSDPYGPFKCQYTCNAAENCSAFFVWYGKSAYARVSSTLASSCAGSRLNPWAAERVGTPEEHLNCALFDAV